MIGERIDEYSNDKRLKERRGAAAHQKVQSMIRDKEPSKTK